MDRICVIITKEELELSFIAMNGTILKGVAGTFSAFWWHCNTVQFMQVNNTLHSCQWSRKTSNVNTFQIFQFKWQTFKSFYDVLVLGLVGRGYVISWHVGSKASTSKKGRTNLVNRCTPSCWIIQLLTLVFNPKKYQFWIFFIFCLTFCHFSNISFYKLRGMGNISLNLPFPHSREMNCTYL